MNKKIALIASTQGDFGGIEAFVTTVAQYLHQTDGFDVRVVFKRVKGFDLVKLKKKLANHTESPVYFVERHSRELREQIRWSDLVHVQNLCPDVVLTAFAYRRPVLATVHNYRRDRWSPHRMVWSLCSSLVSRRYYNSRFVWKTWEPGREKVGSECVPTVCSLSKSFTPFDQRKGFLFVGRWIPHKGIEQLIEAYSQVDLDRSLHPLTILGDGPLRDKVMDLASQLGLDSSVHMPGFVSVEEKQQQLTSCKWLVAPANTKEDMGLTPIEARAAKTGVIVSRDGGLPESGGPGALVCEPGDVADLASCLEQAAAMDPSEYVQRCESGFDSLSSYLKPMDYYPKTYDELLSGRSVIRNLAASYPS